MLSRFRSTPPSPYQVRCELVVDGDTQPQAAALRIGVGWYMVGTPTDTLMKVLHELLPQDSYTVFAFGPSITQRQRRILFGDLYFICAKSRYAQRLTPDPIVCPLPDGYRVLPMDRHLLEGELDGVADLRESILGMWQSLAAFETDGFGFAAVHESLIVSRSYTDCVCKDRCEIVIETHPSHRLKGLGAHVASRTANEAFERGLNRVGWMSWANNAGSIAVSKKAGFSETCEYDVYITHWPAENPEDMTADEFRAFALDYEKQFSVRPPSGSGYPHVVAAMAWALASEGKACREQLNRAIDRGWLKTLDQLQELLPELFLRGTVLESTEWIALFARLEPAATGS
ncbi:MAG: GNAT family N-acetyltransferase [Candidatus Atribacteria bacterium]|nr:MAG: GNAT family N-acetyltransferase [Candidatus Atribacteria bacterium]